MNVNAFFLLYQNRKNPYQIIMNGEIIEENRAGVPIKYYRNQILSIKLDKLKLILEISDLHEKTNKEVTIDDFLSLLDKENYLIIKHNDIYNKNRIINKLYTPDFFCFEIF